MAKVLRYAALRSIGGFMDQSSDAMHKFMQAMADANYAEARRQARKTTPQETAVEERAAPAAKSQAVPAKFNAATATPSPRPINAEYLRLMRQAFGYDVATVARRSGLPA